MKNLLFISVLFLIACGPSKEELEWKAKHAQNLTLRKTTISIGECNCGTVNLYYYDIDSCEYLGKVTESNSDLLAHAGQCKYCRKRQAQLIDSLIKKNLKEFFELSKNSR